MCSDEKSVTLFDFGIAKRLNPDTKTFRDLPHAGTLHYEAPETLSGWKNSIPCTAAVDIFAFGVILSQLITLCPPPFDVSPQSPLRRSGAFGALALMCLDSQASARPTAGQIVFHLSRFFLITACIGAAVGDQLIVVYDYCGLP